MREFASQRVAVRSATSVYSRVLRTLINETQLYYLIHSQNFRSFYQKPKSKHRLKCCYRRLHGALEVDKLFRIQQLENVKGQFEGSQKSVVHVGGHCSMATTGAAGKGTGMVSVICGQMLYHRESVLVSTVAHSQE